MDTNKFSLSVYDSFDEKEWNIKNLGYVFTQVASLNTPRYSNQSFGKGFSSLTSGGQNASSTFINTTEIFNGNSWDIGIQLPAVLANAGSVGTINNGLFIDGTTTGSLMVEGIIKYNGVNWSIASYFVNSSSYGAASSAGSPNLCICVPSYYNNAVSNKSYFFNGSYKNFLQELPSNAYGRKISGSAFNALATGGGNSSGERLTDVCIFNGGSWYNTSKMNIARGYHISIGSPDYAFVMYGLPPSGSAITINEYRFGDIWTVSSLTGLARSVTSGYNGNSESFMITGGSLASGAYATGSVEAYLKTGVEYNSNEILLNSTSKTIDDGITILNVPISDLTNLYNLQVNTVLPNTTFKYPKYKFNNSLTVRSDGIWQASANNITALNLLSGSGGTGCSIYTGGYTGSTYSNATTVYDWNSSAFSTTAVYPYSINGMTGCGTSITTYRIGGYNGSYQNYFYTKSLTTSWSANTVYPYSISKMAAATTSNIILTAGGYNGSALNYTYLWDTSAWSAKQNIITASYSASLVGGSYSAIYVGGRVSATVLNNIVTEYDGTANVWFNIQNTVITREYAGISGASHDAFVYGGNNQQGNMLNNGERYNGYVWRMQAANMLATRTEFGYAAMSGADRAMVVGGRVSGSSSPTITTEKFEGSDFIYDCETTVDCGYNVKTPADLTIDMKIIDDPCINELSKNVIWKMAPVCIIDMTTRSMVGNKSNAIVFGSGLSYKWNGTAWSAGASMSYNYTNLNGCGTSSSALKNGGVNSSVVYGYTELYNGTAWTTSVSNNTARHCHQTVGTSSAAMIVGGSSGTSIPTTGSLITENWNGTAWSNGANLNMLRNRCYGVGNTNSTFVSGYNDVMNTSKFDGNVWSSGVQYLINFFGGYGTSGISNYTLSVGGFTDVNYHYINPYPELFNGLCMSLMPPNISMQFSNAVCGDSIFNTIAHGSRSNCETLEWVNRRYNPGLLNGLNLSFELTDKLV